MNRKTKNAITIVALAIALTTLSACPPEEESERQIQAQPEIYDFEDFWPIEVGNFWQFIRTNDSFEEIQYTFEIVKDYSSEDVPAWGVSEKLYNPDGSLKQEGTYYWVLRKDLLVFTESKNTMLDMVQNPTEPLQTDDAHPIAPRLVYSGSEIQNFDGNLDAIAGSLADLEIYVDCGQPHDLVGPPDLDAIATLQDGACSIDDPVVLQARTIFARGIGPVFYFNYKLVYAIVGNTEYDFES